MSKFKRLPRSHRLQVNGLCIDVWQIGGQGWSWTILENSTGTYLASGKKVKNCYRACRAAINKMLLLDRDAKNDGDELADNGHNTGGISYI